MVPVRPPSDCRVGCTLATGEPPEQRDQNGQADDGNRKPTDDRPPAVAQRPTASILAGETDGPGARAAFGQHAAVAADRLMATRTRSGSLGAATHAARDRAVPIDVLQLPAHAMAA